MAHVDRLRQLAACLIASNRYKEAENLITENSAYDNSIDMRYYLGLAYAMQGKIDNALLELKAVLEKKADHELSRKLYFKLIVQKAATQMKEKNWEIASSCLTLALAIAPNTEEAQKELSQFKNVLPVFYVKANKREEAAKTWEKELKEKPGDYGLIHNLAVLFYWWAIAVESGNGKTFGKGKSAAQKDSEMNGADRLWKKAIIYWAALVNLENFWQKWKTEKEGVWNTKIKEEDIQDLRNTLVEDKLMKMFLDYIDKYKQNRRNKDLMRHEEYLTIFLLEKESAHAWKSALDKWKNNLGINIDAGIKRYKLIRAIQQKEGFSPCFGMVKNCKSINNCLWSKYCFSDRERELFFNLPAGYLLLQELDMLLEAHKLIELFHKDDPSNESLGKLRLYFSPTKLGRIFILVEKQKNPRQALTEWDKLPRNLKYCAEGKYIHAYALMERGRNYSEKGKIDRALSDWATGIKNINEAKDKDDAFNRLLIDLKNKIEELVVAVCEKEVKTLSKQNKIEEAIAILGKGLKIVNHRLLKEHMAILYCDRGEMKLGDKRFAAARADFERALSYNLSYKRAKQRIGTTYNNEGVATTDHDKAIKLFKKALQYDPDDNITKKNLAGALNSKGVEIWNRLQYSSYNRSGIVSEALALFREAHENDPYDNVIVRNYNMALAESGGMNPWR